MIKFNKCFKVISIALFFSFSFALASTTQLIQEEKFLIYRLAPGIDTAIASDTEGFEERLTPEEKKFYNGMKEWHEGASQKLKALDPLINQAGAKGYRNLCLLQVNILYKDEAEGLKRRDATFEKDLFLSGRDTINQKETKKRVLESKPADPSKLDYVYLNVNSFYPSDSDPGMPPDLKYENHMKDYFELASSLDEKTKILVTGNFETVLKKYYKQSNFPAFVDTALLRKINTRILENALLYLPFTAVSKTEANKWFKEDIKEMFKKFNYHFCDSEQAIRLFIAKQESKDIWRGLSRNDKNEPMKLDSIVEIFVNIASVRYMCPTCQGTYLYDIYDKKDIQRAILRGILEDLQNPSKKGVKTSAETVAKMDAEVEETLSRVPLVVYVSGYKPTSKDEE